MSSSSCSFVSPSGTTIIEVRPQRYDIQRALSDDAYPPSRVLLAVFGQIRVELRVPLHPVEHQVDCLVALRDFVDVGDTARCYHKTHRPVADVAVQQHVAAMLQYLVKLDPYANRLS